MILRQQACQKKNYKASYKNSNNWPNLVQLAWITYEEKKEISVNDFIIKPECFTIPKKSSDVHRITQEIALKDGKPLKEVLNKFYVDVKNSNILIAHNIDFDRNIIASEYYRNGAEKAAAMIFDKKSFCTMKNTVEFCKLPGPYGWKWPKLQELYKKLFNEEFEDAHDALNDIRATAKCFFELRRLEIFE